MIPSIEWARVNLKQAPRIVTPGLPGPRSHEMHARAAAIMKGYSSQVQLLPYAGCATPEETALSHRLFTAALQSQQRGQTIWVENDRGQEAARPA